MFDAIHLRWIVYWTKRLFFWLGSDRPWRMYSRGRSADSEFSPSELLYFRFLAKNLDDAGGLGPAAIRSVDQSVNRQKYSKPFDVLIPEPTKLDAVGRVRCLYQGVAAFPVDCVPADLKDDKGQVTCKFRVEHDPLEYNYAHAEIRAFVEGKRLLEKKGVARPSDWKKFRMTISEQATVVVKPLR